MSDTPSPKFLGVTTGLPTSPDEAELDYVANPRAGQLYLVRFAAPEFTSLCPVTGQPDFAHIVIDYAPGETIVESKSLKLFLGSFRNHCGFHEDVTVGIGQRLFDEMPRRGLGHEPQVHRDERFERHGTKLAEDLAETFWGQKRTRPRRLLHLSLIHI